MSKLRSFEEIIMGKSSRQLEARIEQSQQEFQHRQRANWSRLVPELAFVLLRCGADRKRVFTNEIASEAVVTYQGDFGYEKCPDQALVLLTLLEAKNREWGYVAWSWFRGWKLTKKGLGFAKDVERRRAAKKR
jgi:hypothetical protein